MKPATIAKILALGLLTPHMLFAQATSAVNIAIEGKSFVDILNDDARINLLSEALRQYPTLKANGNLEISAVRLEAKSGVGGAQFFLRVNNAVVDGATVETNSKLKDPADTTAFVKVELKNIDRNPLTDASLMVQSLSNLKLRNIQLVLGSPEEPAIFGHYADQQAAQIGGGATDEIQANVTTQEQVDAVFARYYGEVPVVTPAVVDPYAQTIQPGYTTPVPAERPAGGECLVSTRGVIMCIAAVVSDSYEGQGVVTGIQFSSRGNHQLEVMLNNGRRITVGLNQLAVIDNGSYRNTGARTAPSCVGNLCVGQSAMDRNSQLLTIRDIQTFRGQAIFRVESRYGQSFYMSSSDLTAAGGNSGGYSNNGGYSSQPQAQVQQQPQVQTVPVVPYDARRCVSDKKSRQSFCVGTRVSARTNVGMKDGYVVGVKDKAMGKDTVDVRFDMGTTLTYRVDEVFKK